MNKANMYYIVRHGETENNRAKRLSGWIDTPLTDDGLVPTSRVITKLQGLHFEAVYSSDLGRAFITAYAVTRGLGIQTEIIRLAGLREVNYGAAANMHSAEAYQRYPRLDRDTAYCPPGGESLAAMQQRVFDTLAVLDQQHSDANLLLVCHSGTMAALRSKYIGQDFGAHNISEAYPHDYVGRFTYSNGSIESFESC